MRLILTLLVVLLPVAVAAQPASGDNVDPFEPFNRAMFRVNNELDRFILKPAAQGYDFVMPAPAKRGVSNVFANLYDATSAINAVLEGDMSPSEALGSIVRQEAGHELEPG